MRAMKRVKSVKKNIYIPSLPNIIPVFALYFIMNSKIHKNIFLLYNEIGVVELSQTESLFCSNFYLINEHIENNSTVEFIVDNVVKPDTKIYFAGKVKEGIDCTHYYYSASVSVPLNKSLPLNKQIRHCTLSINDTDGTTIGLYNILNNINGMYQLF